jgi:hypothetical protein
VGELSDVTQKPAVPRDGDGRDLREYLIATAARLIGQRGSVLPRVLFAPPGSQVTIEADLAGRVAATVLAGVAPRS